MIQATNLSKAYGDKTAVDGMTFTVEPGRVTGFLGPNGAGKSTTLRMIMGLSRPTKGAVTLNGVSYARHKVPLREAGALLEAKSVHPGHTPRTHLSAIAATHGVPAKRVHEVLEMTGLQSVSNKQVRGFSLRMGQRLGLASALLGDPQVQVLDEPINGLDPDGVLWVRNSLKDLANIGRTVFLSSHLMSEMAQTADHLIVIGQGKILADAPIQDVLRSHSVPRTHVKSGRPEELARWLAAAGAEIKDIGNGALEVKGVDAEAIAQIALTHQILVSALVPVQASLEEAYMRLTKNSVDYESGGALTHAQTMIEQEENR